MNSRPDEIGPPRVWRETAASRSSLPQASGFGFRVLGFGLRAPGVGFWVSGFKSVRGGSNRLEFGERLLLRAQGGFQLPDRILLTDVDPFSEPQI
jgi:hypothetical protein